MLRAAALSVLAAGTATGLPRVSTCPAGMHDTWDLALPGHFCMEHADSAKVLGMGKSKAECEEALISDPGCENPGAEDNKRGLMSWSPGAGDKSLCTCTATGHHCDLVPQPGVTSPTGGTRPEGHDGHPDLTMNVYYNHCVDSERPVDDVGMGGDPFTHRFGQKVQFFLPPRKEVHLATCGRVSLHGRVMSSELPGDASQWFDKIDVTVDGKYHVVIETQDVQPRPGQADGEEPGSVDVRVTEGTVPADDAGAGPASIGTLNVTVAGRRVSRTGSVPAAADGVSVSVSQSQKRVGSGRAETVRVAAGGTALSVSSAVAGKLASEAARVRYVHLDVAFLRLEEGCTGILPEIWGMKSMSEETAKLLLPTH